MVKIKRWLLLQAVHKVHRQHQLSLAVLGDKEGDRHGIAGSTATFSWLAATATSFLSTGSIGYALCSGFVIRWVEV